MKYPTPKTKSLSLSLLIRHNFVRTGVLISALGLSLCAQGISTFEMAQQHAIHQGGRVVFIEGISMEPRLTEKDLVVIVPVAWQELKIGDIVQFYVSEDMRSDQNPQATWIHQVAAKEGDWIRTVGVNNPELDPFWVHRSDVLGKGVAVYIGGAENVPSVSERAMAYMKSQSNAGFIPKE